MSDVRLIERWLPIAALGEESSRERRSLQELPPVYYLHVWWARRPLIASRAAILASILTADADHGLYMHALGIHGDPVGARRKVLSAKRSGVLISNPYDYNRAYTHAPDIADKKWMRQNSVSDKTIILDPTAGGGSIPFEAARLGLSVLANDLNPVAALILKATVEWPITVGPKLAKGFAELASEYSRQLAIKLSGVYTQNDLPNQVNLTYLWAHTVECPYCAGKVPLSPNQGCSCLDGALRSRESWGRWEVSGAVMSSACLRRIDRPAGHDEKSAWFCRPISSTRSYPAPTALWTNRTCPLPHITPSVTLASSRLAAKPLLAKPFAAVRPRSAVRRRPRPNAG